MYKFVSSSLTVPGLIPLSGLRMQVDVFAVYAITLVGGRHVIVPTFNAAVTLLTIGDCQAEGSKRILQCLPFLESELACDLCDQLVEARSRDYATTCDQRASDLVISCLCSWRDCLWLHYNCKL